MPILIFNRTCTHVRMYISFIEFNELIDSCDMLVQMARLSAKEQEVYEVQASARDLYRARRCERTAVCIIATGHKNNMMWTTAVQYCTMPGWLSVRAKPRILFASWRKRTAVGVGLVSTIPTSTTSLPRARVCSILGHVHM